MNIKSNLPINHVIQFFRSFNIYKKSICCAFLTFCLIALCPDGKTAAQSSTGWPCFHGPDRTNKSFETGLMKQWAGEGPTLKWTVSGLGEGYSSVSFGEGLVFTAGKASNQTYVFCFDENGKSVWKKPNGEAWSTTKSWAVSYTGARSTPTYDNGLLYHVGETGNLTAFNAKTGDVIWSRDLIRDFDAPDPEYGYAESVLIEGISLFVRPAGKKGFQVCLNKENGALIWANTEIPGTEGYSSPVILDYGGYSQIINSSSNCYYAIDKETGDLLWKADFANQRELNIMDAIVHREYVFLSSGYGKGSKLIKLNTSGGKIIPEPVWESELMDNHHGGVILHNGYLYGSGSNSRGWFCLDFLTGKQMWKTDGKGSVTFADGMLYMLDERGTMKLAKATPEEYNLSGEFKVSRGGEGMFWAHPVVYGGTLYVRHADNLYAYDIKQ